MREDFPLLRDRQCGSGGEEGIVFEPQDYKYSSAVDYCGKKGMLDNICIFEYFEV
jgi:hypothetical protein